MAWRRAGDKPLSEPMMVSLPTRHLYASLGLHELIRNIAKYYIPDREGNSKNEYDQWN